MPKFKKSEQLFPFTLFFKIIFQFHILLKINESIRPNKTSLNALVFVKFPCFFIELKVIEIYVEIFAVKLNCFHIEYHCSIFRLIIMVEKALSSSLKTKKIQLIFSCCLEKTETEISIKVA